MSEKAHGVTIAQGRPYHPKLYNRTYDYYYSFVWDDIGERYLIYDNKNNKLGLMDNDGSITFTCANFILEVKSGCSQYIRFEEL
jgi:hypothetical protein